MNKKTNIAQHEEDKSNTSLEALLLQSDLMAGMARADGRVLDVENLIAESYIDTENITNSEQVKSHYTSVVDDENTDTRVSTIMSFMANLSLDDKYRLLRCLSAIAMCDNELHPKEADLLKQFAKAMDIDFRGI